MTYLVVFILTLILQVGLLPGIFPSVPMPELFLPVIIAIAIIGSCREACIFALVSGFILDFYFIKNFGLRTLLFFAIAYFLSSFRDSFSSKSAFVIFTLTLPAGLIYLFAYFIIANAVGDGLTFQTLLNSIFSWELPIMMVYSLIVTRIFNRRLVRR